MHAARTVIAADALSPGAIAGDSGCVRTRPPRAPLRGGYTELTLLARAASYREHVLGQGRLP